MRICIDKRIEAKNRNGDSKKGNIYAVILNQLAHDQHEPGFSLFWVMFQQISKDTYTDIKGTIIPRGEDWLYRKQTKVPKPGRVKVLLSLSISFTLLAQTYITHSKIHLAFSSANFLDKWTLFLIHNIGTKMNKQNMMVWYIYVD